VSARLGHRAPADQSPTLPGEIRQQIWPEQSFQFGTFGPRQHLKALHPGNTRAVGATRKGVIAFAQRIQDGKTNWQEWTAPIGEDAILQAEEVLRRNGGEDIFVSQQAFGQRRGIADLTAIGSNYVDLDYHKNTPWQGRSPTDVAAAVIDMLNDRRLPLPSYILSTGRGLVCVWLTELLPFGVLPRWNAVQKALADALRAFGADRSALDAARVFRLVGSVNSRADHHRRFVGMIWYQGTPESPTRHEFSTLADEVLPFTRAEIVSLRAERATRRAEGHDKQIRQPHRLTKETLNATYFEDLQRLRLLRNPVDGTLRSGQRDIWIFLAGNCLSWLVQPMAMEEQIRILAMQAAGWTEGETRSRMNSVARRARQAAEGLKVQFRGRDVDPRYRFSAKTMIEWLQIDPEEQRAAGLRVLVDEDRKRELNTERTRESRHRRGGADRSAQQAARLELGRKALALASTSRMTRDELSRHFGVSAGQISKAIFEAKASAQ
jgi:hypothetical protein